MKLRRCLLITVRKVYSIEKKQGVCPYILCYDFRNIRVLVFSHRETLKENKSMFCGISRSNLGASKIKGVVSQLFQQELKLNKYLSPKKLPTVSFADFKEKSCLL